MAEYASFLVARQVAASTMQKNLAVLRKLLCWRIAVMDATAAGSARLQAVDAWMDKLMRQAPNAALPCQGPMARTKLPHAREVLKWQLQVDEGADALLAEDKDRHGKLYRTQTARALQDSAFLAVAFGYLPTPRLACIRSCCHPDHVSEDGGCMDDSCR